MAPRRAAELFRQRNPNAAGFRVSLHGSLASTGRGHLTDAAVKSAFQPLPVALIWQPDIELDEIPNGMLFEALDLEENCLQSWKVFSSGGGALRDPADPSSQHQVYSLHTMTDILKFCSETGMSFWEYVERCEGPDIWAYLTEIRLTMYAAIDRGLQAEGVLPGGLGLARKALTFYRRTELSGSNANFFNRGYLSAYALATSEENATGGLVVTAPTCGSCGVLPAVLRYLEDNIRCTPENIYHALATAGLVGNLIKHNASIAGSVVGCQGEVGAACSMAAAAATQILGGTIRQIEYAAEMGLEHYLGLTCDPVDGLVQIPCIERNAFAASQAISCASYACSSDGSHRVSFDEVVEVMEQTGHDLPPLYRETSNGGLSKAYRFPSKDKAEG